MGCCESQLHDLLKYQNQRGYCFGYSKIFFFSPFIFIFPPPLSFQFVFLIFPPPCFLPLSIVPRHSLPHFVVAKGIMKSKMKKMKRCFKRYTSSLYYHHRVKSGRAWRMMQLLRHLFLKKLKLVIRFIETSLLCTKLRLTSRFITGWLFNRSLIPISTNYGLNKLLFVFLLVMVFVVKHLM